MVMCIATVHIPPCYPVLCQVAPDETKGSLMKSKLIDLGNNEALYAGVFETPDGFLAMTFSKSKTFKTRKGAEAWFARMTNR